MASGSANEAVNRVHRLQIPELIQDGARWGGVVLIALQLGNKLPLASNVLLAPGNVLLGLRQCRLSIARSNTGLWDKLRSLQDQKPAGLVLVQSKLLDGHGLSPVAVGRFNRAELFAAVADDDDAPASRVGGGVLSLRGRVS